MATNSSQGTNAADERVPAGELRPWGIGELPPAPAPGWRQFLGPGILLAGVSIGSGEWLFGPAVSAQYGGTLLWLASLSILSQVFCNLAMMRYTLYCGEPIMVGFFRTWPGPWLWTPLYALLDTAMIWPYNASNAAVPLAAAILGHLPGSATVALWGTLLTESQLVKLLGYGVFLGAFIPLIFGGTVYKMLERVMTLKILLVLGYLTIACLLTVSPLNMWEVISGFFRFGALPLRADTVISGTHFTFTEHSGTTSYTAQGTLENGQSLVTSFVVNRDGRIQTYGIDDALPPDLKQRRDRLADRARALAGRDSFRVESSDSGVTLTVEGKEVGLRRSWQPERFSVRDAAGLRMYERLEDLPKPLANRFRTLIDNRGSERINFFRYYGEKGRLPHLDWAMLAAFAAIAGAGNLANTMFSSYARDKGWGMGARVGAIPSAVGGRSIKLSHVGQIFRLNEGAWTRWRGWLRHILKDQVVVWMLASFLGMALPCMLSLEFIRNASVSGNRVAAMTALGMAERFPEYRAALWFLTLMCGFLILAPGQIFSGDQIARRWTDIIWTASGRAQRLKETQVKYVYYGILLIYCVFGLVTLSFYDPLQTAKIGAVIGNVALAVCALHTFYVMRTLMPRELRPNWFMQAGVIGCGAFFLGITVVVVLHL